MHAHVRKNIYINKMCENINISVSKSMLYECLKLHLVVCMYVCICVYEYSYV